MQMAALRTPWSTDRNACTTWYAPARPGVDLHCKGPSPVRVRNPSLDISV